ncbi:glycosyltransferase [Thomasclavelia spiroformis]|uniref:glycosyltransferase n=1 Tax=Thomasclavelia spiroformis TaxID=29348 RepID=UPI0024B23A87|nr:glycosyltransferase [Thomasclavelia spiroformis]
MKKIRIIAFELQKSIGGIETFLINLYQNLDKKRFQLDFVTDVKNINELPYVQKLKGANIYTIPGAKNPVKYIKKINSIFDRGYDIAYFNKNSAANVLPIYLAKKNKNISKLIIHSHNTNPSRRNLFLVLLHYFNKRYLNNAGDAYIACSNNAGKWLFSDNTKFLVVKDGINVKKFIFSECNRVKIRDKYNISISAMVIGFIGRFTQQKNLTRLVDIFYQILKKKPETYLLLVGDGPEKQKLQNYVNHLKIQKHVFFVGEQLNTSDYLSAMDVFVMPSIYEGLAISAIEAQASGSKVFISDKIPDEARIVPDVKVFNLSKSTESIANLIINNSSKYESKIDRMKKNKIVFDNYDIQQTVKDMEKVYINLVGGPNFE